MNAALKENSHDYKIRDIGLAAGRSTSAPL